MYIHYLVYSHDNYSEPKIGAIKTMYILQTEF